MKWLVKGSLNKPVAVIVIVLALAVFSVTALTNISLQLMPDMSIPVLVVYTVYPGASPEEMDELVTDKISSACESISGLKNAFANSSENSGYVMMQFDYGIDMDDAYSDVRSAIDRIYNDLPDDCQDPTIIEIDTSAMADMNISVAAKAGGTDVLREVEDNIEPELRKVSSVADITINGGDERYISVELIPEYAEQYGLGVQSVVDAIAAVNFSMPAGTAEYGDQKLNLNAEVKYESLPELEQVPITIGTGQVIHLSDVAKVHYAVSEKNTLSRYMGENNVSLEIQRKQSASAVTLSRAVNKALDELRVKRPDLEFTVIRDSANTIMERLTGVGKTVLQAVLLAMLILFIFFGDLKASLIVGSSMPISIMTTLICMSLAGLNLNVVTLGALMIAVGMMTDNAVVVIEMCFRQRQMASSFKEAAYKGTSIVLNSVIGSTITTVVVYVPLSIMEGLSGQMFKQLGFTIIFALVASLISAITIIPLCFMAYQPVEKQDIPMTRFLRWVSKHYAKVLRFMLKWKKTVFLISILVLIVTFSLARFLRTELMSQTDEGIVNVSLAFRPNLKIEEMDKEVKKLEEFVMAAEEIEDYSVTVARTSASATITANKSDDSKLSTQEIVDKWNQELKGFSNLFEATASAGSSMGRSSMGSPNTKEFDFVSTDRDKLKATADEMVRLMENTEGVLRAESSVTETGSKAMVVIDPVMARTKGFSAMQLAGLVYMNMSGSDALDVTIDSNTYTVTVEYPRDYFETISDVEAMTFTNAQGLSVPLTEVGEVRFASAPQTVVRKDGLYQAAVTATMTALTKDAVTDVLQEKADKMVLDPDVSFATDAQTQMMQEEFASIGEAIFIGVFLVFIVMAVQFNSIADSLLIMTCIPFAGVGSILFLLAINAKISMTSLMGVLMLAGIVVNNGIILIDMAIQNQESGMDTVEALVDAGAGRLRPILMTTLTTILAMVPTAVGWSKDSSSLQGMAGVIVGGLIASTILTLLLLPTFYLLLDRLRARVARLQEKRRLKNEERVRAIEEKERKRHAELMEKEKAKELPKKNGPDPLPVSKPDDEEGNAAEEGGKAKEEAPKDGED